LPLETITCELSKRGVATITLNRPDRGNAFNQTMLNELGAQLAEFASDESARVIVLRGRGKHFCTGADVTGRGGADAPPVQFSLHQILAVLDAQPQPTLAVVQGAAAGGGAALGACCDIVVAAEQAFFSIPEVRLGMAPVRLAPFLIRAMGQRSFRRYGLSGERISAAEALRIGLAHAVCGAADLDGQAAEIIDALLHGAAGRHARTQAGGRGHGDAGIACFDQPGLRSDEIGGSRGGNCELSREAQAKLVPGALTGAH
jgi:methylglutaconyl-CoA hydratase